MNIERAITTPNPDPTELTTSQLTRELLGLRELLETRILGLENVVRVQSELESRMSAMINAKTAQLQELHDEKFHSISVQFAERDTRTEQTSRDSKVAVDAALQAAKEAVGKQQESNSLAIAKSEAATTKQIDLQSDLMRSATKSTDDKIDDLKTRLTTVEGLAAGKRITTDDGRSITTVLIYAGTLFVAILALIVAVFMKR